MKQCKDGQTSTENAARSCLGCLGAPGIPGAAKLESLRALSRCKRVNNGMRSPPCTGSSCSSGTPACLKRLMASLFATTIAPVRFAIRSAPGRLEYHRSAGLFKAGLWYACDILIKVSMRNEDVIGHFYIVHSEIRWQYGRLVQPGIKEDD